MPQPFTADDLYEAIQQPTPDDAPQQPQTVEQSMLQRVKGMVIPALLPTAGGFLGYGAGALTRIPGAGVVGESLGSAAGEAINQAVGITEPSKSQVAFSGAAPGIGRGVGKVLTGAVKQVTSHLPGAGAALRDRAVSQVGQFADSLKPPTPSESLFDELAQYSQAVVKPLPHLKATTGGMLATEASTASGLRLGRSIRAAKGLQDKFFPVGREVASVLIDPTTNKPFTKIVGELVPEGTASFGEVFQHLKRLNLLIGAAKAKGGEELGHLLDLKRALAMDLQDAASQGGMTLKAAELLQKANRTYRQEIAQETVENIMRQNITALEGRETWTVAAGKARKALTNAVAKDRFLADSFPKGSLESILSGLDRIRKLPVPGAPPGADAGSKRMIIAGTIGTVLGQGPIGTLAGIGAAEGIAKALSTKTGTDVLVKILGAKGGLTQNALAAIADFTRAQTTAAPDGQQTQSPGLTGDQLFEAIQQQEDASIPPELRDVVSGKARAFLKPPAAEGTIPTAGEQAIAGMDLLQFARSNDVGYYRSKRDGTEVVFRPGAVSTSILKQLDKAGRLADVVNGAGTSPKPANPTTAVTARTPRGTEVRTVRTATPQQTRSAVQAQPPTTQVEVRPFNQANDVLLERLMQIFGRSGGR